MSMSHDLNVFLQVGTQFWDEKVENELAEGRLSSTSFDRYIHNYSSIWMQTLRSNLDFMES